MTFFSAADQYKIFDVEKSDIKSDNFVVNYGEIKMTRDQEIASISKEIEELHHLDESHWAIRKQREASTSLGVQVSIIVEAIIGIIRVFIIWLRNTNRMLKQISLN